MDQKGFNACSQCLEFKKNSRRPKGLIFFCFFLIPPKGINEINHKLIYVNENTN